VGDELIARVPQLIGMAVAGEIEGALERGALDVQRVELLDDGEEIGQKALVRYRCLCASRYCRASSWRAL
jgi:hypothetical protein